MSSSHVSHIATVVTDELMEPESGRPSLENIHRALGSRCKRSFDARLIKEWSRIVHIVQRITVVVDGLLRAMDAASDYGYAWEHKGWYEDDSPYVGDDTTTKYMSPIVHEFAELFASSCVFMTRRGQRSQLVDHDELDAFTGRTHRQERIAQERAESRKRLRDQEQETVREAQRKCRREELEAIVRDAQREIASLT